MRSMPTTFRRLATVLATSTLVVTPLVAAAPLAAAKSTGLTSVTCASSTAKLDQATDLAPDPDGARTGLVGLGTKSVKYRISVEHSNCIGDPEMRSGKGSGFITFHGTCLSAMAPGTGTTDWFDAEGRKIGSTEWEVNMTLATTSTSDGGVTTLMSTGRGVSGRYANAAGAAPRAAVDGTALSCVGPQPQPITSVQTMGTHSMVGLSL